VPHVAHLPLKPHTVPLLQALPLQHGSPFLPQCWQALPGPKGFGPHTLEKVHACPETQQGEPLLPHDSQRLVDWLQAYCEPAS
jgi:hypothetical protein